MSLALSVIHVSFPVANNFVHSSTVSHQGYHAFGELARFVYCLQQKTKKASSLPLAEQWEEHLVPNHSRFPAIDDKKNFLVGTRVMAALGKVGSHYLQTEFCTDARRFLEDFVNCVLSTVASRSVIHWTGSKLLLSCNCGWWGRCCSSPTFQQTPGWATGEELDQRE